MRLLFVRSGRLELTYGDARNQVRPYRKVGVSSRAEAIERAVGSACRGLAVPGPSQDRAVGLGWGVSSSPGGSVGAGALGLDLARPPGAARV
jgi:hypothetical protein